MNYAKSSFLGTASSEALVCIVVTHGLVLRLWVPCLIQATCRHLPGATFVPSQGSLLGAQALFGLDWECSSGQKEPKTCARRTCILVKSVEKSGNSLLPLADRVMRWLWVMACGKPHFWAEAFLCWCKTQ